MVTVQKVWSYNPTLYKTMNIIDALKKYQEYVGLYIDIEMNENRYGHGKTKPEDIKSFSNWLETEI